MRPEHKQFISEQVQILVNNTSGKRVSTKAEVSNATISKIINEKWDSLSDEIWAKVQVNLDIQWEWVVAPISNYKLITDILKKAKKFSLSVCISDKQALGKTETYKDFARKNRNVFIIECKNSWSYKSFAEHQLRALGLEVEGTTEHMIAKFVDYLKKMPRALVIYDQFDKTKERQRDLFMDYHNELPNTAFVLSGVSLQKQEEKGVKLNKMGYRERYSRYGSKFIKLNPISLKDVKLICNYNGVTDGETIEHIYEDCEGDLRRVRRSILLHFVAQSEKEIA